MLRRLRERPLLWMVVAALALRLIALNFTYRINPKDDHFEFGWEMGRVARALAAGKGFSSPFQGDTGPTALVPPVYPALIAAVFKLTGTYTNTSAWLLLALNSVFAALTCMPVYRLGEQVFSERVARWSGWLWALFPYFVYWPIRWVWETSLSVLLLTTAVWLTVRLAESGRTRDWLGYGALWGLIALTNTALVFFLPFALGWLWYRRRFSARALLPPLGALAVMFLIIAPWVARNYLAFGEPIFIRSNFGMELWLGNYAGADGLKRGWRAPAKDAAELELYRKLGEPAYMCSKREEAVAFIAAHPGEFAAITLRRVAYFWIGTPQTQTVAGIEWLGPRHAFFLLTSLLAFLGLWKSARARRPAMFLFAALLLFLPLPYYITHPHPRYRHVMEPEMLLLTVCLFGGETRMSRWSSAVGRRRKNRKAAV